MKSRTYFALACVSCVFWAVDSDARDSLQDVFARLKGAQSVSIKGVLTGHSAHDPNKGPKEYVVDGKTSDTRSVEKIAEACLKDGQVELVLNSKNRQGMDIYISGSLRFLNGTRETRIDAVLGDGFVVDDRLVIRAVRRSAQEDLLDVLRRMKSFRVRSKS